MITKIFTDYQRQRIEAALQKEGSAGTELLNQGAIVVLEMLNIERRLEFYQVKINHIEDLITKGFYEQAREEITYISHLIHQLPPDDPLYVFNVWGHQINLELVGMTVRVDVVLFLGE